MGEADCTCLHRVFSAAVSGVIDYIPIMPEGLVFDVVVSRPTICHVMDIRPRGRNFGRYHITSIGKVIAEAAIVTVIIAPAEGLFFDVALRVAGDFRENAVVIETLPHRKGVWLDLVDEYRARNVPTVIWDRGDEGMLH